MGGLQPGSCGHEIDAGDAAALVQAWVDAHNRRDRDALVAVADAAIELHPSTLVGDRRVYRGHDGLRTWLDDLAAVRAEHLASVEKIRLTPSGVILIFGDVIVDGEPSSPFSMWMRVRDGRVLEARSYLTDEELFTSLGFAER